MSVFVPRKPLIAQHKSLMAFIREEEESNRRVDEAAEERLP